MEIIYYTIMGIALYLVSDWILDRIEVSRGARFKHRSLVFFAIILVLAFISFNFAKFALLSGG